MTEPLSSTSTSALRPLGDREPSARARGIRAFGEVFQETSFKQEPVAARNPAPGLKRNQILFVLVAGLVGGPALSQETTDALKVEGALCKEETVQRRAREVGISPGILEPGRLNAITDVEGVKVGHVTLKMGSSIKTGATAILPHGDNVYQNRVPAGLFIANGHGKSAGLSQIAELGEIETPIVLTNTLAVSRAMDAVIDWTLSQPGNEMVRSVNAVVGETNDSTLNDIRGRALTSEVIVQAIEDAKGGAVEEGAVGAGTGTVAFGWKGGIGTSSRVLPDALGAFTVGALVQSNFGGVLSVDGRRIGEELGQYYLKEATQKGSVDGSIMIILATDAPLSDRNLERLAGRAMAGLARTGASFSNGSGDYAIAFSTAESVRRTPERRARITRYPEVSNDNTSPLFQAAAEAVEEAIYNSLLMAETTVSYNVVSKEHVTINKLPIERLISLECAEGEKRRDGD